MDERNDTQRIGDLEAWAFRAGRDLAEIKGELKLKSTVTAVDALHQDVADLRTAMDDGFAAVNQRLDSLTEEAAGQRQLLEEILRRLPA